jgi:hypothetical protein
VGPANVETKIGAEASRVSATAWSRSSPSCERPERLQAQGQTLAQVCKRLGISDQTFFRRRIRCGALKEDEAQRLKTLEAGGWSV